MGECIDASSPYSRSLATEVTQNGISRILVVNTATGASSFLTRKGVVAHCPVWSPDGAGVAFQNEAADRRDIDVIRADGSGMRSVSGNLIGFEADGPDTWSSSGWIYFGAQGSAWRANVMNNAIARVSDGLKVVAAPASSPDGFLRSYIVATNAGWGSLRRRR